MRVSPSNGNSRSPDLTEVTLAAKIWCDRHCASLVRTASSLRTDIVFVKDRIYGAAVTRRLRAMGIRDKPIAPSSPWQNAYAERLIGTIRRDCLDHMIVFGEAHLRRILGKYAAYYNSSRIHLSLNKDAPFHRAIQRVGAITSRPVLGGLHHQYCRI
jgi:Integrase core domain